MLRKFGWITVLLIVVFGSALMAQDEVPVEFGIVCELSGHGASHGALARRNPASVQRD